MDLRETPSTSAVRHPWETVRFRFFSRRLEDSGGLSPGVSILDVGAGDVWFSLALARALPPGARLVCWDEGYTEAGLPELPPQVPLRCTATRPTETFDVLLLLDVLEHVERDTDFLRTLVAENLRPGGLALISVPAWPKLFSEHDRFLKHWRRYRAEEARSLIASGGLEMVREGGLFYSLLAPRYLSRQLERVLPKTSATESTGQWNHGALLTMLVERFLFVDATLSAGLSRLGVGLPGLSWWALCRKA